MKTPVEPIRAEIARRGAISCARFMELALYCPDCGFYEKENDTIGKRGDFITSVSVGPLFGELLARQFAQWLGEMQRVDARVSFQLIEAGAHDGQLACDILTWLQNHRTDLSERTVYGIVEPSAWRKSHQQKKLAGFPQVKWFSGFSSDNARQNDERISQNSVHGVIFSNELLDAMPVHRFGWDGGQKQWFEWGVTEEAGKFFWTHIPSEASEGDSIRGLHRLNDLPAELLSVLPDGFTTEISLAAETWWRHAAMSLACGKLMTIDYGLTQEEYLSPHRAGGTLRAYRQHQPSPDPLADPGHMDLTAHVNFSTIQSVGEHAGLRTERIETQTRFLNNIAAGISTTENGLESWATGRVRQFQTLTHPELMGHAFRVLVQSR